VEEMDVLKINDYDFDDDDDKSNKICKIKKV
jgi:hypothetical protein